MKIIYPNGQGGVAVCSPVLDCGLTIEQIAKKDIPNGLPYKIVEDNQIPSDDFFFDAFEADFSSPDGVGEGSH